jgi:hypothetical protein
MGPSPIRILHFSDTHNNRRATGAVIDLASALPDASIAFTGDICTYGNKTADPRLNSLVNLKVWIVPGEHDLPSTDSFRGLVHASWSTPFLEVCSTVKVIGLDTTAARTLDDQISTLRDNDGEGNCDGALVLGHNPLHDRHLHTIAQWLSPRGRPAPIVVCHGHVHHDPGLSARAYSQSVDGVEIHFSHVYSANTTRDGSLIGAANLIEFHTARPVKIHPVLPSSFRQNTQ